MKTVTLESVVKAVSRRLGRHPDATSGIEQEQRAELLGYVADRLRECWCWAWWPELMRCEERAVATDATSGELLVATDTAAWSAATTYAIGDVVERFGLFYEAILAGTNQDPVSATTYWTALAQTPIGTVKVVTSLPPMASAYPDEWPWLPKDGAIVIVDTQAPAAVWVTFRIGCPELTATRWDDTIGYVAGDRVYDEASGDCWTCVQATTGAGSLYWQRMEIPAFLRQAVADLATADAMVSDDREGQAERWEDRGYDKLEIARALQIAQQGVTEVAGVVNLR